MKASNLKPPLVSIILTTHKRANILPRALTSLVNQTFQNFEIILISDCYDIATVEITKKYLRENDTFIMSPFLIGPSESRNLGINIAKGTWVGFLDDDDAYSPNLLNDFSSFFKLIKSDIYYTNYIKIKEDRSEFKIIGGHQFNIHDIDINTLMISNFIPNSCIFVNRLLAKEIKFDCTLKSHEDWDWLIQLKRTSTFQHLNICGPIIYESTENSRNLDSHKNLEVAFDFLTIYRKWRSKEKHILIARKNCLQNMGLSIDDIYL